MYTFKNVGTYAACTRYALHIFSVFAPSTHLGILRSNNDALKGVFHYQISKLIEGPAAVGAQ